MRELDGRSAIVTGGAGGLGSATVRRLAAAGLGVVVFDRDAERAGELAKELGDAALATSGDVTDDDDVTAAIDAARSLGVLSVLVNVAGGGVGGGRLVSRKGKPHDRDAFVQTMDMNAFGTFNVSRLVAAAMGTTSPMTTASAAWWSTPPRSPGWRARAGRWPTGRPRRRSSA